MIEGIRNGQPLGALLGYQLERGLHENDQGLKLDEFIDGLRQQFPLVANQLASTKVDGVPIDTIEANNVIDGMKLTEHIRLTGKSSYPYGLRVAYANHVERSAIDMQVGRLLDAYDAIADLAIAEGVHEAVLGNYDRVSATLEAYSKGTFPPEPEVVRTPRSGLTLTHRVAIHFDPSAASPVSPLQSPRAWAQPMINAWLASGLPDPHHVACLVVWTAKFCLLTRSIKFRSRSSTSDCSPSIFYTLPIRTARRP